MLTRFRAGFLGAGGGRGIAPVWYLYFSYSISHISGKFWSTCVPRNKITEVLLWKAGKIQEIPYYVKNMKIYYNLPKNDVIKFLQKLHRAPNPTPRRHVVRFFLIFDDFLGKGLYSKLFLNDQCICNTLRAQPCLWKKYFRVIWGFNWTRSFCPKDADNPPPLSQDPTRNTVNNISGWIASY